MSDLFKSWAVVELMGHRRLVGNVQEVEVAGTKMIRVDVLESKTVPAYSQFYGGSSIYCLTPITEETAKAMLSRGEQEPFFAYGLKAIGHTHSDQDDEEPVF